jgi:hypothetical protein
MTPDLTRSHRGQAVGGDSPAIELIEKLDDQFVTGPPRVERYSHRSDVVSGPKTHHSFGIVTHANRNPIPHDAFGPLMNPLLSARSGANNTAN